MSPEAECKSEAELASPADSEATATRLPIAFVAHGAPLLALDGVKGAELHAWAARMPRPGAILVLSPHWQTRDPTIGATRSLPLLYDFSGFPEALSQIRYAPPPAPELAARLAQLHTKVAIVQSPDRRLDHGAWVPLLHMYPEADIPVVQLSLPRREPEELFDLGRLLAPLADEGTLILCSGVLVHNLRSIDFGETKPTPPWAKEFDAWCEDVLLRKDFSALVQFRVRAPKLGMAHPTEEHFLPLLVAAGASSTRSRSVTFPITGFEYASLSRRCVQMT
jgi:4,5-DOPA dioxygenase extradiol